MSNNSFKVKNGLTLTPTDPSTLINPQAGDLVCDSTDNNKIKRYDDISATWTELGSGGGGLDTFYTEDMEAGVTSFVTGNNATFLGGGSLAGTLTVDTVSPISGTRSLKYTQAAGSLNDYFASDLIYLDSKQKNNTSGMTLYFTYNGNDNDMKFVVWDVTNNQRLSSETAFVKLTGKSTRYSLSFYVPTTCTQIRWGVQVIAVNSGKILVIDDVEMSTDPFMEGEITNLTDWQSFTPIGSWVTNTSYVGRYRRVGDSAEIEYRWVLSGSPTATNLSINLPTGLVIDTSKLPVTTTDFNMGEGAYVDNGVAIYKVHANYNSSTSITLRYLSTSGAFVVGTGVVNNTSPFSGGSGDFGNIRIRVPILGWTSSTPHVLTPVDTFSTDTAPLTYASSSQYTLSTLANAPVGTYITFTYAANTNTRTQTTGVGAGNLRPTQTDADMNVNGIRIYARAYNAASTGENPAAIAIQIGKGLKGVQLNLYKSAGKVTSGSLDLVISQATNQRGITWKDYNESTGILTIDAGFTQNATNTANEFQFSDVSAQTNGYLTINASKSAALTAVPTPLVAYLKDVKTSGTAGGTFTAGAWQTRTLNTLEGDTSFVTLSANQFTLPAGRYEIEASAPAYKVNQHQVKLRNITDSTDSLLGSPSRSAATDDTETQSQMIGTITLTSAKIFEIQHIAQTTQSVNGFGSGASFGVNVTFTQVKIKKVG